MNDCIHREAIAMYHPKYEKAFLCQRCGMTTIDDGRTWQHPDTPA